MAGFITFGKVPSQSQNWSSANWIFRSFLDSVIASNADDKEMVHELTVSVAHQQVELAHMAEENQALFHRVIKAFLEICDFVKQGSCRAVVDGRDLDEESQRQYREAVSKLSAKLEHLV